MPENDVDLAAYGILDIPISDKAGIAFLDEMVKVRDERIEALREALRPFAAFADPRRVVPVEFVITPGSSMAKRQLTMGDCYAARDVLAETPASPGLSEPLRLFLRVAAANLHDLTGHRRAGNRTTSEPFDWTVCQHADCKLVRAALSEEELRG